MKNILLVEDDEDDCLFLRKALAALTNNIALSCTQTTDQIFDAIKTRRPSLIIMDYHLPKRSGVDCLRQIKSHPDYQYIPVVMWSTSKVYYNEKVAYSEGAQAFIQKPYSYPELVIELKTLLEQNGLAL